MNFVYQVSTIDWRQFYIPCKVNALKDKRMENLVKQIKLWNEFKTQICTWIIKYMSTASWICHVVTDSWSKSRILLLINALFLKWPSECIFPESQSLKFFSWIFSPKSKKLFISGVLVIFFGRFPSVDLL